MSEPTKRAHTLTVTVDDCTWEAFLAYCRSDPVSRCPGTQVARFLSLMAGAYEPAGFKISWLEEVIHCAFLKDGPGAPPKMDPHRIYLVARGKAVDVTNRFYKAG